MLTTEGLTRSARSAKLSGTPRASAVAATASLAFEQERLQGYTVTLRDEALDDAVNSDAFKKGANAVVDAFTPGFGAAALTFDVRGV